MMATIGRAVRGLAAAVALAALLGGVPALLVVGVGWPLPTSLPDWHAVENTFTQQGVPPRMVVDVLALVCWTAWALIVVSFFVEAAAVLRRRQPPSVPLAGPLQSIVGALVAVIAVAVLSGGAGRHATPAGRPTPLAEVVARTVVSTGGQTMAQEVGNPAAPGPVYVVRHRDTLWGIAQRELGDALRWRELFDLNRGRLQPDGGRLSDPDKLFAGWRLILPGASQPVPPATSGAAGAWEPLPPPPTPTAAPPTPAPSEAPTPRPAAATPSAVPAPRVPRVRGGVVDLPSGGVVALSFASGVGTALAFSRLLKRRGYRPGEPRALREGTELDSPPPLVRHLRRLQLQGGQGDMQEEGDERWLPLGTGPQAAALQPGEVVVGEVEGRAVIADLAALGGLGLVGVAADTLRAVALDLVMRAGSSMELILADEAHLLALENVARSGVHLVPTSNQALAAVEAEVLRRSRLLATAEAPDIPTLAARDPDELLPLLVLIATADPMEQGRLDALLRAGRQLRITGLIRGECSSGVTIEVGEGGRVLGVTGHGLRELTGGRTVLLPPADGLECAAPLREEALDQPSEPEGATPAPGSPTLVPPVGEQSDDVELVGQARSHTAVEMPRPVRVALLGGYRIEAGEGELKRGVRTLARAILAYLLLHPRGATAEAMVDVLCDGIEPDRAIEHFHAAMGNLRNVLRRATGLDAPWFIERVGDLYRPDAALFDCDVWRFESALAEYESASDQPLRVLALEGAVAAYGGDLLDQTPYEWPEPLRESIRRRATDTMVRLAAHVEGRDPERAAMLLERAIGSNPEAEDLYRRLMRLYGGMGRADAVRRTWRQLIGALGDVDADPDENSEAALTEALKAAAERETARAR